MKTKKLFHVSALWLCLFSLFTACGDENETIPAGDVPDQAVSNLLFGGDTDPRPGIMGGVIEWTAPQQTSNITRYALYHSSDGQTKDILLGGAALGENSFEIPNGTISAAYIVVVAANQYGESTRVAGVKVGDYKATPGFFFLSNGNMGDNNSELHFYDSAKEKLKNSVFLTKNLRGLGDTGNDMIAYGSKLYVAVYGSGTIEVTDLNGNSIRQIKPDGQPRYLAAHQGKIYATLYNGYVARIDTATFAVEAVVKVGRNPEQIVVANQNLYIANSGGMDFNTEIGYDNTVSVVNIESFTEVQKLEVVLNPCNLVADNQGDVYVVSMGNYGDVPNTLQRIDASTGKVQKVNNANATEIASAGDRLYMIHSQYDAEWNQTISYILYDALGEQVISDNFIGNASTIPTPFKISTDRESGLVFISSSDYVNEGDFYVFDAHGTHLHTFRTGLNPIKAVVLN